MVVEKGRAAVQLFPLYWKIKTSTGRQKCLQDLNNKSYKSADDTDRFRR